LSAATIAAVEPDGGDIILFQCWQDARHT
jgi:hypothetical protein